jgi:FKBP-type peptidyl-prolyl cis-trans isomerase FkpA
MLVSLRGVLVKLARVCPSAFALVALLALSTVISGCSESPTSPSNYAPFSQTDLRLGSGEDAVTGKVLTVTYTGWLYDASQISQKGATVDSSVGRDPFTFTLGAGSVIAGWDLGLVGMKAGGLRRLVVPPSLGYGQSRVGPIPPNATLLFEVELLEVK